MHKCKWIPILILGVLGFILGAAWIGLIQDSINTLVTDPIHNLMVKITVTIIITILASILIWFLAGCWNDKEHWFGKMVYCNANETKK